MITRYQGIAHYDWIAVPLLPYLYAVVNGADAPARVDHETVNGLRDKYHAPTCPAWKTCLAAAM